MKIRFYYAEDLSAGGGAHKQIADTYEFDLENNAITFTQKEKVYVLATDRVVPTGVYDDATFIPKA